MFEGFSLRKRNKKYLFRSVEFGSLILDQIITIINEKEYSTDGGADDDRSCEERKRQEACKYSLGGQEETSGRETAETCDS